jgi:hypothetical protein
MILLLHHLLLVVVHVILIMIWMRNHLSRVANPPHTHHHHHHDSVFRHSKIQRTETTSKDTYERQFYGYKRYLAQQDKQMINWFRSTNRLDNTPLDIIRDYGKFTHKDESDHIVIYLIT